MPQVTPQVTPQVEIQNKILNYCTIPRKRTDIVEFCGYKDIRGFAERYINPLLEEIMINVKTDV